MTTVLVTGGSGFIGTWVVRELLARQMQVVVLDVRPATQRWERVLGERAKVVDLPSELATTHDIVRQIEQCLPAAAGCITVSGPAIPPNVPPDFRDIRQVLPGWEPTSLADGVARTIAYYRQAEGKV